MKLGNINLRKSSIIGFKKVGSRDPTNCLSSSHLWDIGGAQAVVIHTCWIDHRGYKKQTDEIDIKPDIVCTSIENIGNDISRINN